MKRSSYFWILAWVGFLLLANCTRKTQTLSPEASRLAHLYAELVLLKAQLSGEPDSVFADSSLASLKKYHFTPEDCKTTIEYLHQHPEKWVLFYREVSSYLENPNKSGEAPPR